MKINQTKQKTFFIFFSIFTLLFSLPAESFRIKKVHILDITNENQTSTSIGINESLAITLPEDKTFIEGIEVKMVIPEAVAVWRDSVACSLYNNIRPNPSPNQIDYSGTRLFVKTVPPKLSWILQIPLRENSSLKSDQYTTLIDSIPDISKNVIFLRFQPAMKGIPEETMNSSLQITVKPLLINKGRLRLSLTNDDNSMKPCTLFIDDETIDLSSNKKDILLPAGIHNISVISEFYRSEMRTVRIDLAKNTDLQINMKSIEPTLLITKPEGVSVFLDDIACNIFDKEFTITEGDHKIKFIVGNYEAARSLTVIKGKTYKVNFNIDLQITEE